MGPTSKEKGSSNIRINTEIVWYHLSHVQVKKFWYQSLFMSAFPNVQLPLQFQHYNQEVLLPRGCDETGVCWYCLVGLVIDGAA